MPAGNNTYHWNCIRQDFNSWLIKSCFVNFLHKLFIPKLLYRYRTPHISVFIFIMFLPFCYKKNDIVTCTSFRKTDWRKKVISVYECTHTLLTHFFKIYRLSSRLYIYIPVSCFFRTPYISINRYDLFL